MGAGAAAGAADQIVSHGGINGFNWATVGTDAAIGGAVPGVGAAAASAGVGNVVDTVGTDVLGGIGSVACSFSGGRC
jgi:hypothetical protein